jgi:hypothetical protein
VRPFQIEHVLTKNASHPRKVDQRMISTFSDSVCYNDNRTKRKRKEAGDNFQETVLNKDVQVLSDENSRSTTDKSMGCKTMNKQR